MSHTIERTCRSSADRGKRLVNNEHLRDCNASGCPGCKPCVPEHGHCTRCGVKHLDEHHPRTCDSCVGQVRNDILEIGDQIGEAHAQFVHRSVASMAFMISGPAANYEAGSYVHQSATSGRLCKCAQRGMVCPAKLPNFEGPVCTSCSHESCRAFRRPRVCPDAAFILEETRTDELHPLTVLGAWDLAWRRVLGHDEPDDEPTTWQADARTTWSAATYLLSNLTYMAQHDGSAFDEFADEIYRSRSWLEEVLRTGSRPDEAGWCPMCHDSKLVKDWDPEDQGTEYTPDRDGKEYADIWYCPNANCGQTYSPDEYRGRLDQMWVAGADRLPVLELATRLRIPASTIRRWASTQKKVITPVTVMPGGRVVDAVIEETPPRLRSCGLHTDGRKLYRVKDVEALRDNRRSVVAS